MLSSRHQPVSAFTFRVLALSLVFASIGSIFIVRQELELREQFAKELSSEETVVPPSSKPPMTQESIDIAMEMFNISIPKNATSPKLDMKLEDRGLTTLNGFGKKLEVTIGPAAFTSWAVLGSTLAHEVEIHCNQNFSLIRMKDMLGLEGTNGAEREAYMHELSNSDRFKLKEADQASIRETMEYYYPARDGALTARK
ncbi:MAG: hypothetical protein EOP10_05645 [Proteobacteria bacterium]|nr:MAG: hypothetical protein EOP10_05645 [Pseudomonadota bacterium]